MSPDRCRAILAQYPRLRVSVVGDFFLDRYLEIDPARGEVSIETGLPVHNVVHVRSQPGAAGTILNNLVALGVGTIHAVGFSGGGSDFSVWTLTASTPAAASEKSASGAHRALANASLTPAFPQQAAEFSSSMRRSRPARWAILTHGRTPAARVAVA